MAGIAGALALTGCAGTWDTLTSRKFRNDPFDQTYHLFDPEDPIAVLWADPPRDGNDRAKAMLRLEEPLKTGLTQQDQDAVIDLLSRTATADPSPVLRLAAIQALGRFDDPRAPGVLMQAYQSAHGRSENSPLVASPGTADVLAPPTGFGPETVDAIRCRALEALGRTDRPEAVQFLASVAAGPTTDTAPEGSEVREVRLAAVRGLSDCRQPESVVALSEVLAAEDGRDPAIVGRAHHGLVHLTGKRLPPDPQQWNQVVQAGATVAPEPTWFDDMVNTAAGWVE